MFLCSVRRGCLVQAAASPPAARGCPTVPAGTTEAQDGEWALSARSLPRGFPAPKPMQGRGCYPWQHLPACRFLKVVMRLRGLGSLQDGCRQGRSPTSTSKQPPSPQLTWFLGDLRHAGSLSISSLLLTLYLSDSSFQLNLASTKHLTKSFCEVHACTRPSVQQPPFPPIPQPNEPSRADNPFSQQTWTHNGHQWGSCAEVKHQDRLKKSD